VAKYTVVLVRMMSQVRIVEAANLKAAVAAAMERETLSPDSDNDFDPAGDVEVQVVELEDEEIWNADRDSEDELY
jgi:hypothetical protein